MEDDVLCIFSNESALTTRASSFTLSRPYLVLPWESHSLPVFTAMDPLLSLVPDIANDLYSQPFPVVDITVIDDNELVNHRKVAVMELAMKHKDLRENVEKVTTLLAQAMNNNYHNNDDIITIFNYLFLTMDSPHFKIVVSQLINQIENNQEAIMNIAQRLKNQGMQEGIDIGVNRGIDIGVNRGIDIGTNRKQHEVALKGLELVPVLN